MLQVHHTKNVAAVAHIWFARLMGQLAAATMVKEPIPLKAFAPAMVPLPWLSTPDVKGVTCQCTAHATRHKGSQVAAFNTGHQTQEILLDIAKLAPCCCASIGLPLLCVEF